MKLLSFFSDINEIFKLIKYIDLPSKIKFLDEKNDIIIEILITINNYNFSNDIFFEIRCYQAKNQIDILDLNPSFQILIQSLYIQYVQKFLLVIESVQGYPDNSGTERIFHKITNFLKLNYQLLLTFVKEFRFKMQFIFLESKLLNIYTVNGYDSITLNRTIIKSLDRVFVMPSHVKVNAINSILFHNLNVKLIEYVVQNRKRLLLKMLGTGIDFLVTFVRFIFIIISLVQFVIVLHSRQPVGLTGLNVTSLMDVYNTFILPNLSIILSIGLPIIIYLAIPKLIQKFISWRVSKLIGTTQ